MSFGERGLGRRGENKAFDVRGIEDHRDEQRGKLAEFHRSG